MKIIKKIIIPKKRCHIQCSCEGRHYLQFLIWERMVDEKNEDEIDELYATIGASQISRLRDRIKIAWRILRDGEYENYGVLVNRNEIKKLIKYLKEILEYWNNNYKK